MIKFFNKTIACEGAVRTLAKFGLAGFAAFGCSTHSSAAKTHLVCEIDRMSESGVISIVTGADHFTIVPRENGTVDLTQDIGCAPNTIEFNVTETEYRLECRHLLVEAMEFLVTINRLDGGYEKILAVKGKTSYLMSMGRCRKATPQF